MAEENNIADFAKADNDGFFEKRILIEGDSWVSYPFPEAINIATCIDEYNTQDYLLLNLAEAGDEANAIFKAHGRQMKQLKRLLNTEQWGNTFDLILLSAAGNDIVGPEIVEKMYVKNKRDHPNAQGRELLTDNYYDTVADIVSGYDRFLKMRDNSALNPTTPVITHVYSYLKPREVGITVGKKTFTKGWVKIHLKRQGVKDEDEQIDIIAGMLDALYKRLVKLQDKYDKFLVVDTRKVLSKNGMPDMTLWQDEIHPNTKGFKKTTNFIRKEATAAGMWAI